jgi:hypothetical protein
MSSRRLLTSFWLPLLKVGDSVLLELHRRVPRYQQTSMAMRDNSSARYDKTHAAAAMAVSQQALYSPGGDGAHKHGDRDECQDSIQPGQAAESGADKRDAKVRGHKHWIGSRHCQDWWVRCNLHGCHNACAVRQ